VGQWSSVGGGKVFRIVDIDEPTVLYKGTYAWSDLGKIEIYPVMDTKELLTMLARQ
jgi:hypothetical protein